MPKITAQEKFWNWFVSREPKLFAFDPHRQEEREAIFDEIVAELRKVDLNLVFEFGPEGVPRREFVVSADGLRRAFPAVISLVDAAPPLRRWRVIAFRPRRWPLNTKEDVIP